MTKRGLDDLFEFLTKPRTIIGSLVWGLTLTTAVIVYETSKS